MLRFGCIAITAGLLLSPDVPQGLHLQAPSPNQQQIPSDQTVPVLPNFTPQANQGDANASGQDISSKQSAPPQNAERMREESRLQIIRSVSGEFVRMASPLPGGKQGFHVRAGQAVDQDALHQAIQNAGAALYTGDKVQITKLDFHGDEIVVDINGGGRGHTSWKDHLQLSLGMPVPVQTGSTTTSGDGGPVVEQKTGSTLYLDFSRDLPDMTPEQLKQYLSGVFDFSKERSAAVQWTETLPAEVKEAIAEKRAAVGMDHDMVLAALGRPDRKVREHDADGNDTEDWIYGTPPSPTTFVRFEGDKVVQIDQYPR